MFFLWFELYYFQSVCGGDQEGGCVVAVGEGEGCGVQTGWPPSQPMTHVQRRRLSYRIHRREDRPVLTARTALYAKKINLPHPDTCWTAFSFLFTPRLQCEENGRDKVSEHFNSQSDTNLTGESLEAESFWLPRYQPAADSLVRADREQHHATQCVVTVLKHFTVFVDSFKA